MSIVNDPMDEDEQYEMEGVAQFEEEHPLFTAMFYLLILFAIAFLLVLVL